MKNNGYPSGWTKETWIKSITGLGWLAAILFVLLHRADFTLEAILSRAAQDPLAAAGFMLCLFGLKSLTFFVYAGLLYLANGILFGPWPGMLVSLAGSLIMVLVPYGLGRYLGGSLVESLMEKHPNLQQIRDFQSRNAFGTILAARSILRLPSDVVSLYFGSTKTGLKNYLAASLLACLPNILAFSWMGNAMQEKASGQFWLAALFEAAWALFCFVLWKMQRKKQTENSEKKPENRSEL